jgi:hypothetical protein
MLRKQATNILCEGTGTPDRIVTYFYTRSAAVMFVYVKRNDDMQINTAKLTILGVC